MLRRVNYVRHVLVQRMRYGDDKFAIVVQLTTGGEANADIEDRP